MQPLSGIQPDANKFDIVIDRIHDNTNDDEFINLNMDNMSHQKNSKLCLLIKTKS